MLPFELTKYTPYLALSGELWSVFYEYFNRNWSCYKGFLLYLQNEMSSILFNMFSDHKQMIFEVHIKVNLIPKVFTITVKPLV